MVALLEDAATSDAATLVRRVFAQREAVQRDFVEMRSGHVLSAPERLASALGGWLAEYTSPDGMLLDLGCGPGQLLAAAARRGQPAVGVDIALEWIVVAGRLVSEHGGVPMAAAACGEALPVADESIASIVGLDANTSPTRLWSRLRLNACCGPEGSW